MPPVFDWRFLTFNRPVKANNLTFELDLKKEIISENITIF